MSSGGAERVTANLANYWSQQGRQVTILTLAGKGLDFYELHPAVNRISLNLVTERGNFLLGPWNNVRRIWMLRKVLKEVRPDVVVSMMTRANVLLALAASGISNMCAIGSERVHPPTMPAGLIWGCLRAWTYGKLSAIAAQTLDSKAWLQSNTYARNIAVIPNPVQFPLPIHQPIVTPEDIVVEGRHVLLAGGRLDRQKGFDLLIDVFAELAPKHSNWILVIFGEGPQRKALEAQILTRGMDTKIFLPGVIGNLAHWYFYAELFVSSSRFEGFPNTLLEALVHGLPAVSFDCATGPRDIIRNGVDGFLAPAGDLSVLTSALDQLMSDETMRRSFAERATEVRERFSMERIAGLWDALFMELRPDRH